MGNDRLLLQVDSRGRISLGPLARSERNFFAEVDAEGRIVLTPAVVMTRTEMRLAGDPELVDRIERAIQDPATRMRPGRRPKRQ